MAYGRRYKKRSMRKRARKGTRKAYRRSKPYQTRYVRITRWSNNDTGSNCHIAIPGNNTTFSGIGNTVFRLDQAAGYSELVGLFDNYCLRRVLYRWVILRDPSQNGGAAAGNGLYPRLTWVHDFNDSNPISRAQMMQHPRMREVYFTDDFQKTKWYSLKPASLTQQFESPTATAYKPVWGAFVDTNDSNMAHYGIKYTYDQNYSGMTIMLEAKLVFDCKGIS